MSYEENYYEKEIIQKQDEEPIKVIDRVSNDESNKESDNKSDNKSNKKSDNESIEEIGKISNKKSSEEVLEEWDKTREEEFIEDLKQSFSLNNKSTTNSYDKNRFDEILTTIDSNNFNYKNKIGKFKFNDINDLINNIKNNTISEANAKKKINELNEIKKCRNER